LNGGYKYRQDLGFNKNSASALEDYKKDLKRKKGKSDQVLLLHRYFVPTSDAGR
jgi:hypothetical protein